MKMLKCRFLIIAFLVCLNCIISVSFAGRSPDITPKDYIITITNIPNDTIKDIKVLYGPTGRFNYDGYQWDSEGWSQKYGGKSMRETIPTLTTAEINDIAKSVAGVNPDSENEENSYWVEKEKFDAMLLNNSLSADFGRIVINTKAEVEFLQDNSIRISYPGVRYSSVYSANDMFLEITKSDGTVIYSERIYADGTGYFDENTPQQEIDEIYKIEDTVAYFEVDFSNLKNHFVVAQVNNDILENEVIVKEYSWIEKLFYLVKLFLINLFKL